MRSVNTFAGRLVLDNITDWIAIPFLEVFLIFICLLGVFLFSSRQETYQSRYLSQ